MVTILQKNEAFAALEPFHEAFAQSLFDAGDEYFASVAPHFANPFDRTVAAAIHDLAMRNIALRLGADPRVKLVREHLRFVVYLKDHDIVVRIKKLNKSYRVSNYPTRSARQFNRASPWVPLFGDACRLTLGYRLDKLGTSISRVMIALLDDPDVIWSYELSRGGAVVTPFPSQQDLPLAPTGGPLVRAKPSATRAERENEPG